MRWYSLVAIYFVLWWLVLFAVLPFGVKTHEEVGVERVPGQADSAPHRFDLPRHLMRAAVVAALLTALYVANYLFGWVGVDDLDFYN